MGFINIRAFGHAVQVILGKYDTPDEPGEVSHAQALFTALSATVGLGNIAGVAIAIHLGGPGAVVWMTLAGFLGMSTKFVECTLGQKYRIVDESGHIAGGPMYYLSRGLSDLGRPFTGQVLAATFSGCCLLGALGGGNMFPGQSVFLCCFDIDTGPGQLSSLVWLNPGGVSRPGNFGRDSPHRGCRRGDCARHGRSIPVSRAVDSG